jgi:GT2 family glycosyltransferase
MLSVIVATAYRMKALRDCLESLSKQTLARDEFEVIVINNIPESDGLIRPVVESMRADLPIQYAIEARNGLSFSRNLGISMARGDILVFIDDDAVAEPRWLAEILELYETYPQAAAVGGRIDLFWESLCPEWLDRSLFGYLGELDYGDKTLRINPDQRLGGGNFSIKREWLERCGGFSPRLGRNQRSLLSGEEVELLLRVQELGGECYYVPSALVYHPAPISRLNKKFFRQRVYWGARSAVRVDQLHTPAQIQQRLMAGVLRFPYHSLRSVWYSMTGRRASAFLWESYCWSTIGYCQESLLANREHA